MFQWQGRGMWTGNILQILTDPPKQLSLSPFPFNHNSFILLRRGLGKITNSAFVPFLLQVL